MWVDGQEPLLAERICPATPAGRATGVPPVEDPRAGFRGDAPIGRHGCPPCRLGIAQGMAQRERALHPLSTIVVVAVLSALVGACGSAPGAASEEFCENAQANRDVFTGDHGRQVSPAIIGTLRDLADEAPDEFRDDFEVATTASSDEELDEALADIKHYIETECGVDLEP